MMQVVMARKLNMALRLVGCMMPFPDICGGVWILKTRQTKKPEACRKLVMPADGMRATG
jgi:hypothetical protein